MRARYKGPFGTGILELDDHATIQMLFEALKEKTLIESFTVKYGPPSAMHTISLDQADLEAKSFGLHGETLTIVPASVESNKDNSSRKENTALLSEPGKRVNQFSSSCDDPGEVVVAWPEREGTLLLRVMPSDNSCLFTAFGGALERQIPSVRLRQMMAEYIVEHPDIYNEAILGCPPTEYCFNIQDPDRWGGGIELSILSTIFDIQICTFDVQGQQLINFGENKRNRCILVYSGIHYDRVAFSYSEPPHDTASLPPEMDRTIWSTVDSEVLEKTKTLVQKLHVQHYYTDTDGLVLKCNQLGCEWIGNGQLAAKKHAELTGHTNLSEISDVEDDNVLRKCLWLGCGFIGQGKMATTQHQTETGHHDFDIIPDS